MPDITRIAQDLLDELKLDLASSKGKIDGVVLLYNRIRQETEDEQRRDNSSVSGGEAKAAPASAEAE